MSPNLHNVLALKQNNRASILERVRRCPISRADISRQVGLSKAAVTTLTAEMIEEGLLQEIGRSENTSQLGRKSILVDLVPSYAYAIGVTLHRRRVGVCATDLKAQCLFRVRESIGAFESPDEVIGWVIRTIRTELERVGLSFERCVGIGVSGPGPLDYRSGVILEPPGLPLFRHYPVTEKLREQFDCPVYLENNAVALAQLDFYRRGGPEDKVMFVVAADGIGSALLLNGRVFRGSQGFSGELGHISIDPDGKRCGCGNRGCLEQYATLSALKERFGFDNYESVMDQAADGDAQAQKVMTYLVNRLGTALVNCVNMYDLDSVVLFGEYAYHAEQLTRHLQTYIREHSLVCRVHPVSVVPSQLSREDEELASAISALNGFFANSQNR